jgi:cytochrome c biogenesis factor
VLFLGFSAMVVPFAFAVAALWKKRYTQWVRPALPWTLFAVMSLGVAIAMGGYWAYVTLSFGGYWAWDPVENSSLVPWLLGVAAFHTMLVQKKSGSSQKASLILSIAAYLFVVYSTFLTRSGILGDVSVHSFVSLGLYNQLLIWIAVMGALGIGLFAGAEDALARVYGAERRGASHGHGGGDHPGHERAHLRPDFPGQSLGRPAVVLQPVDAPAGPRLRFSCGAGPALLVEKDGRGDGESGPL